LLFIFKLFISKKFKNKIVVLMLFPDPQEYWAGIPPKFHIS